MVSVDVKHHVYKLVAVPEAQELCKQGSGAGLSRSELDSLLLQLFSAVGSEDNFFVTLFLTNSKLRRTHVALRWPAPYHLNNYVLFLWWR